MKTRIIITFLLALLLLSACASTNTTSQSPSGEPEPIRPISVAIKRDGDELYVQEGAKSFTYAVSPENAQYEQVRWHSTDETVATVDKSGNVTPVAAGTSILRVTVDDAVSAEITLTVREYEFYAPAIAFTPVDGVTYIEGVLIANKTYALPEDYGPGEILPEVMDAWRAMVADAKADGISLWIISGYRSYTTQAGLYQSYVNRNGQASADTYSARPGHSEHQTGLAFDINEISYAFGETPAGRWVSENAHKYGFIVRYPQSKQEITGYIYEPWHLRYLGTSLATKVWESGLCLEEYFDIDSVYAY